VIDKDGYTSWESPRDRHIILKKSKRNNKVIRKKRLSQRRSDMLFIHILSWFSVQLVKGRDRE
jgi:hypothetical protein